MLLLSVLVPWHKYLTCPQVFMPQDRVGFLFAPPLPMTPLEVKMASFFHRFIPTLPFVQDYTPWDNRSSRPYFSSSSSRRQSHPYKNHDPQIIASRYINRARLEKFLNQKFGRRYCLQVRAASISIANCQRNSLTIADVVEQVHTVCR